MHRITKQLKKLIKTSSESNKKYTVFGSPLKLKMCCQKLACRLLNKIWLFNLKKKFDLIPNPFNSHS